MDLEATVTEIAPALLRYCIGASGHPATGEELAQEALTALVAQWRRHGPPDSPRAFVYTVARRLAVRARWRQRFRLPFELLGDGHRTPPSPEAVAGRRRELAAVLQAVGRLPTRERQAILLAADDDLSVRDAAEVLGISASAFKMRVHRARRSLSEVLEGGHDQG